MAYSDPENKIRNVEAPKDWTVYSSDADVVPDLIAPGVEEQGCDRTCEQAPQDQLWTPSSKGTE